jgi:hypothetical protein
VTCVSALGGDIAAMSSLSHKRRQSSADCLLLYC